jgi:hypothetical protein
LASEWRAYASPPYRSPIAARQVRFAVAERFRSALKTKDRSTMLDVIYIALGVIVLGVFALYAVGLRRI